MIPKDCKRLAEVDFPIAVVSKHAAREKSIRHGHPSTLHLWWARRPLAACRAVLLGLLWPDPCDPHCPESFKRKARQLLPSVQGQVGPTDEDLRQALLKFIGDVANWDLATNRNYLEVSRELVKAVHGDEPPLVVDPFAGGGSIPLEALRVGCEAFASDLNPVACLILKVMLEDIPRHGPELAQELRRVGAEIKKQAEKELAEFYPKDPEGATPIAYLWARTVKCESPNCGAEIPLLRSCWLIKREGRKRALRYSAAKGPDGAPIVAFEIFEPRNDSEIPRGTVTRAKAACPCCNLVLPPERVRAQLVAQQGGADVLFDAQGKRIGGARLIAVICTQPGATGKTCRLATELDYVPIWKAEKALRALSRSTMGSELKPLPEEPLERVPVTFGVINVWFYGMSNWSLIFSQRQRFAIAEIVQILKTRQTRQTEEAVIEACAMALGKLLDFNSSLARWAPHRETSAATFGRQALPMVWDFCETVPVGVSTGSLEGAIDYVAKVVEQLSSVISRQGQIQQADACDPPLPEESATVWFTDPPYYDAVPYSYISDFFYVWLKYLFRHKHRMFSSPLTPKENEAVAYLDTNDGKEAKSVSKKSQTTRMRPVFPNHFLRKINVFDDGASPGKVACATFLNTL